MVNQSKLNNRFTVFAACISVLLIALLWLELMGVALGQGKTSRVPDEKAAIPLELDQPVERELAGGQEHYYQITAEAGNYLRLIVDHRGIDVVVALYGPEDEKLIEVESLNGSAGAESLSVITGASSSYRLEVRSRENDAPAGRYEVRLAELRAATAQDQTRVRADKIYTDGRSFELQSTAESLRKAIAKYEEALSLYRTAGDRQGECDALNEIAALRENLGENRKALYYFNQELPLRQSVGDRRGEAVALNNIGTVYDALGDKQRALDYYNQALALRRAVGDRAGEARTLNSIGVVYNALGEKQKALDYYKQALPLRRAVGDRGGEARTLNNIGAVYESLGETQEALDYYNQSLPLGRAVGDRRQVAGTLNNIGTAYDSLGDKQKALDYYNQALPLRRAVGDRRQEGLTLSNIGLVYLALGDKQKALDYFNQALPISRAVGDRRQEASMLGNFGAVYNSLNERQKALDYYNQALPLSRAVGDRRGEATILLGIAKAESALGQLLDARATIESALSIIESLRTKVLSTELRSSYFATTQDFYEFSIDLLMQLHQLYPDRGYDREALQTAERARARSMLESLVEARLDIRSGAESALIERERELRQLLSDRTERQIFLLSGKHTEQQAAAVDDEVRRLTAEYQELETEIRAKSPRYAALTQPQPLKPEEIQREVLDEGTLLLEYFLGKERSYLWVVGADLIRTYELPKRQEIEEAALQVKKSLAEAETRFQVKGERLSRMILGPALSELSGKRLAIVPDGELQEVAFGALPVPQARGRNKKTSGKEQGDWLPMIAEHEIVSLPSASALAVIRRETAGRAPAPKAVAVLADPVFDKNDGRIRLAQETESLASNDLLRATRDVMGEETGIHRLPFSKAEAEAILSLTPQAESLKALGFEASRMTAISGELSQYRIVHFATHGLLNEVHPELSGVVLSLLDREGKPQDGFLQWHDVYNLNLPAELVVLSACRTGLGKSVRGEGLVGLTRGFMYAGAKRVVASLWSVQDLATADLMKRFYGAMLGERQMRPAAALRAAQVEMWKQKRWRSPYYWGGFMLYGEW